MKSDELLECESCGYSEVAYKHVVVIIINSKKIG